MSKTQSSDILQHLKDGRRLTKKKLLMNMVLTD